MTSTSSLSHTFHAFRPRFWGFSKILGFLSFSWNFLVWFREIVDIWSCIAFSLHYNNVSCILDMCAWLLLWVLIGLDWVLPIMLSFLHVTCSCIRSFFSFLFRTCLSLFFSLSLSDRLCYGTQTEKINSSLEPSSWFRVILFWSSCSLSYLVPWWEGQDGLLWELLKLWRSSRMLGHSVGLLRHCTTRSHLDSRTEVPL